MNLLSIWLISSTENRRDDKIEFARGENSEEMITVTYTPGELRKTTYTFYLARQGVQRYIYNILYSLRKDQDPWEKIQVSPANGPSIMYHVNDLDDAECAILDIVDQILYVSIERARE